LKHIVQPDPFTGVIVDELDAFRTHMIRHLQTYSVRPANAHLYLMADRCQWYINNLMLLHYKAIQQKYKMSDSMICYKQMLDSINMTNVFENTKNVAREMPNSL